MTGQPFKRRMPVFRVVLCALLALCAGCATKGQSGALIGAGGGAAAGQWIGKDTKGTLIGAGVGAVAGYMIGNEMDKADDRNRENPDDRPE